MTDGKIVVDTENNTVTIGDMTFHAMIWAYPMTDDVYAKLLKSGKGEQLVRVIADKLPEIIRKQAKGMGVTL